MFRALSFKKLQIAETMQLYLPLEAQVLVDSDERSQALLLCYRQRRWYVEGIYE